MEGMDSDRGDETSTGALEKLATKLNQFLVEIRNVTVGQYTLSLAQLCNLESSVACSIWMKLFPKMWAVLSEKQRQVCEGVWRVRVCGGEGGCVGVMVCEGVWGGEGGCGCMYICGCWLSIACIGVTSLSFSYI